MYRVFEAERILHNKTRQELADAVGVTVGTLGLKLRGKFKLTLAEAFTLKKELGTDKTLDELFVWEDE